MPRLRLLCLHIAAGCTASNPDYLTLRNNTTGSVILWLDGVRFY